MLWFVKLTNKSIFLKIQFFLFLWQIDENEVFKIIDKI